MKFGKIGFFILLSAAGGKLVFAQDPLPDDGFECPCFSYQEAEALFIMGQQISREAGSRDCNAADYTVEYAADITLWDKLYTLVAQASVEWYDYDRSRCQYIDKRASPPAEREVTWDKKDAGNAQRAKACFDHIAAVITKHDSTGMCFTFP